MENINYVDVVADLSWGDTGKGKIVSALVKKNDYDFVCRWAGGNNAGHTVFIKGRKYKTHLVPSGIFHGVRSIIGPACVVHPDSLKAELKYLEDNGFDTSLVKVSPRAHIVLDKHITEDKEKLAKKLGTTSKGIAPCYSDKMARTSWQAKDLPRCLMAHALLAFHHRRFARSGERARFMIHVLGLTPYSPKIFLMTQSFLSLVNLARNTA